METIALKLVKARIGLRTNVRDEYLTHVISGVVSELEDVQGLSLDKSNPGHLMFVVDYADWRYSNRDSEEGMPRHIQFRLHNLVVQKAGQNNVQNI